MTDLNILFKEEHILVDEKIKDVLNEAGDLPMYHMLRYFMGYENDLQQPSSGRHGKRTRPVLLLLIAKMFGGADCAINLATAVELFHNFTLIHDDIVDNDEMRRGQPTVWKLWGVDHGINAGDAQLILTNRCLLRAVEDDKEHGILASRLLNDYFIEITEGQYLDFELTKKMLDDTSVTEDAYFEMIRKKTAVLVGASTAVGGVATGCSKDVSEKLFKYGEALGLAYQMVDDYVSVWGDVVATGKMSYGDIFERKKTYPVLHTRKYGNGKRLVELYAKTNTLTDDEIREIILLFESAGAKDATKKHIQSYVKKAKSVVEELPVEDESKQILISVVDKLVAGVSDTTKNTI